MLNNGNSKFKECLLEVREMDEAKMSEEMKELEPYEFSEEFEKKMEVVLRLYRRRRFMDKVKRYAAVAAVLVLVAAGGVFLTGTKSTEATEPGVNVLEWLKDYFSFEKGGSGKKENDILFAESQIGFIPEGFEKSGEEVSATAVMYKYMNNENEFIVLRVDRVKTSLQQDSEGIEKEVNMNLAGYEYTYVYEEENQCHTLFWEDDNDLFYNLTGNLNKELMEQIMDGIKYER